MEWFAQGEWKCLEPVDSTGTGGLGCRGGAAKMEGQSEVERGSVAGRCEGSRGRKKLDVERKKIVVTMREAAGRRRSVSSNEMLLFVWQPEGEDVEWVNECGEESTALQMTETSAR